MRVIVTSSWLVVHPSMAPLTTVFLVVAQILLLLEREVGRVLGVAENLFTIILLLLGRSRLRLMFLFEATLPVLLVDNHIWVTLTWL